MFMKTTIVILHSLIFAASHAHAALLISLVGTPPGNRADFTGTVGIEFTVGGSPLLVSALGVEDLLGNGLQESHQVGLWNSAGTLIQSVLIPAGTSATLVDTWRFAGLGQSVLLAAGSHYYIGASRNFGIDVYSDNGLTTNAFLLSNDVIPIANTNLEGSFAAPTQQQVGEVPRWGFANLQYEVVPEASSSSILAVACGLLVIRRKRNREDDQGEAGHPPLAALADTSPVV